jgi:hypothetical protein
MKSKKSNKRQNSHENRFFMIRTKVIGERNVSKQLF